MGRSSASLLVIVVLGLPSAASAAPPPAVTYGPGSFTNPQARYLCIPYSGLGSATTTQAGEIRASVTSHPVGTPGEESCFASGSVEVTYTVGPHVKELPVEVTVDYGTQPDSTQFTSKGLQQGDEVDLLADTWASGRPSHINDWYDDSRYPRTLDHWSIHGYCSSSTGCHPLMPQKVSVEGTRVQTQSVLRPRDNLKPGVRYLPEGRWTIVVGSNLRFDLRRFWSNLPLAELRGDLHADIKQVRVGG